MKTQTPVTHPTKEQVREWQKKQSEKHEPPPTAEQIRRELGWEMERPENYRK